MIDILEILFSSIALPFGFILDSLVMLLTTPVGFIFVFTSLVFFEYKTAESIIKNTDMVNLKYFINYIKNHAPADVSLISSKWMALDIISKKKNIYAKEISDTVGITVASTKKLINGLVGSGHIVRETDLTNRHEFCYVVSNDYIRQRQTYN